MPQSNIIELSELNFAYEDKKVLSNLSFTVAKGEFICLTGKSGCGKSTLLRLMNGLLKHQQGKVEILDKEIQQWEIHELRRKMGYVLQDGALFPHLTVYQNMCYCMKLNSFDEASCKKRIDELLPLVNLDAELLSKFPDELSGGQRQRVGIVRAIAHNPEMVLMDEPFSALDAETRISLQSLVKAIHKKLNTTFIMVTHSNDEAKKLASRIIYMSQGQIETIH
ncbi:ATP-binding cassette domain-containing protein [Labilibacter marinus]|uniref:ATP-binding cassette domain-containing protein n=1 Tax=Labilibacter marinus TaxID=1477105 RepID=UPI00094FD8F9|nr:ABC transporter ATP-binding protein [Labilibacter marinus]